MKMKNIYTIAVIALFTLATSCGKNYRNTSIFETIPESELISKAGDDKLFLEIYEEVGYRRGLLNELSLVEKSYFYSITYSDLCKFYTLWNIGLSNKHRDAWLSLYGADELACDSLLLYCKEAGKNATDKQVILCRMYYNEHNMKFADYNSWDDLYSYILAPQIIRDYWKKPLIVRKEHVIKELINPNYDDYHDYFLKQEFPLMYELHKAIQWWH